METAEDEWWKRTERAETIDYSVRASAPAASNPELQDTTSTSIPSELLASPIFHEKLSEQERCARISTVTKKKDIAQNLYDAYAATLTGYSPDDDDLKELKIRHDDLQLAMRKDRKWDVRTSTKRDLFSFTQDSIKTLLAQSSFVVKSVAAEENKKINRHKFLQIL
ncbi:hypothetical protein CDAR_126211 [Caerostris darwini]|uniref:Uncharacterized protein n=1 Tax=Caerostris darwini TaxID=1538125 RepID=A0AAV4R2W6_9ARAC|nr:hypothetical protein CDAR_126211 [Caerostris darwini]